MTLWFCVPGSHIVFMYMVANNFLETYENLQFLQSLGFILKTLVTFLNSSHSGHNSSLCWLNSGWFSTALPQNTFNDYKLHEFFSHKNTTTTTSQYAHFHTPFKTVKTKLNKTATFLYLLKYFALNITRTIRCIWTPTQVLVFSITLSSTCE